MKGDTKPKENHYDEDGCKRHDVKNSWGTKVGGEERGRRGGYESGREGATGGCLC